MQDPFERADITSNTYWDWLINHGGPVYGVMDEVFKFAATFKEYPPRSIPPSFNPATVVEETIREIRAERKLRGLFPLQAKPGEPSKPKE
jgi:arylsulfatase